MAFIPAIISFFACFKDVCIGVILDSFHGKPNKLHEQIRCKKKGAITLVYSHRRASCKGHSENAKQNTTQVNHLNMAI